MHPYDEAFTDDGSVREPYRDLMGRLDGADLAALTGQVRDFLAERECRFGGEEGHDFVVDALPRVLTGEEWETVAGGVRQRVRALEMFLADAYGEQRLVADGVVPESVVAGSSYFERDLVGVPLLGGAWIGVAGLDLVRDSRGRFRVLEDNVRTPSGLAYAMAASDAVTAALGTHPPDEAERAEVGRALRRALEAANPEGDGALVLLTDGADNSAWYEHQRLADLADLVLATPADVRRRGSRLVLADGQPVRSVYRRTEEDAVHDPSGALTPVADLLLDPLREGTLGLLNRYGTGVADDKFVYAFVDDLVRHLLGEEPLLPSVTTYDLRDPDTLARVLDDLEEMVVKPRDGAGGEGVVVGPAATAAEVEAARRAVRRDPEAWIAQEAVLLSTVPTVIDGRPVPRHCDLRPFAISDGTDVMVPRGGLSRVALAEGSRVVNSSQEGGAKATWVV